MTDSVQTGDTEDQLHDALTVEDILNDAPNLPPYSPLLLVWTEILRSSENVRDEPITPQWANRIISNHIDIHFADMPDYRDLYYAKIDQLREVLALEISTDDECLKVSDPEEDVAHNTTHYLNIIIGWQMTILSWELDWDCTHADAAVELASIAEVHKMFFSDTGLVALLENIQFEFTDEFHELLKRELEELKASWTR